MQKIGALTFIIAMLALVASCSSLDRDLQVEIEAMATTIEGKLDPDLPASFQDAAKRQARETVKYAESNDPLLRRNVAEMLDTIRHDLDPALPETERRRALEHAEAVKEWIDSDERPGYFQAPDTEPANEP